MCPGALRAINADPTTNRGHGSRRGRVEPIRVAVRMRPLEVNKPKQSESAWRAEKGGDGQHWVYLSPNVPMTSPRHLPAGAMPSSPQGPGGGGASSSTAAPPRNHENARFCFDMCFDGQASNSQVFREAARDVIRSSLEGVNSTVLAYGQTNSGKTHTILGTLREPGVLPLAMHDLFEARERDFVAHVSYAEIFNERVADLLASGAPGETVFLPVKEDVDRGFFVQGLSELPVHSAEAVLKLISRGEERRRYGATRWNEYSSRSHALFTLRLAGALPPEEVALQSELKPAGWTAKLSIVDLAGCENQKMEQSEDGRYINRSLFFLGEVISRLCVGSRRMQRSGSRASKQEIDDSCSLMRSGSTSCSRSHSRSNSRSRDRMSDFVPYRDSKLTRILRSSLGGNAVTLLLVTLHPAVQFIEPSLTSLRFATKARCVENFVSADLWGLSSDEPNNTILAQQRIIEGLQQKLRSLEHERHPTTSHLYNLEASVDQPAKRGLLYPENGTDDRFKSFVDQMIFEKCKGLRSELEEKQKQLIEQHRLLSERDEQLGYLREQLGGSASVPQTLAPGGVNALTSFHQAQSRAEDVFLRSPTKYVARQQTPAPLLPAAPPLPPRQIQFLNNMPAIIPIVTPMEKPPDQTLSSERNVRPPSYVHKNACTFSTSSTETSTTSSSKPGKPSSQKELVEKLLQLAVVQINSVKTSPSENTATKDEGEDKVSSLPRAPAQLPTSGDSNPCIGQGLAISGTFLPGHTSQPQALDLKVTLPSLSNPKAESNATWCASAIVEDVELGRRAISLSSSSSVLADQDSINTSGTRDSPSPSRHSSRNLCAAWGPSA